MSKPLPPHPSLKQLKIQAKDLLKAIQAADPDSIQYLKAHLPRFSDVPEDEIRGTEISLKDCQHVIAREYGFESWNWLRAVVEIDFGLLLRLSAPQVQVLLCEVDNPQCIIALQGTTNDAGNTPPCPEELVERLLNLMEESQRAHIAERVAIPQSFSPEQVQEARRHILQQANLLAAHGYISWPSGTQFTPSHKLAGEVSPFLLELVRRPVEEMSVEDIAELSGKLTFQARRVGIVSLRVLIVETVDPFLREAIQLAVDGKEPDALRRLLEARIDRAELPAELEKTYRLIIVGILSTQAGDNPGFTRQIVLEAAS